MGFRKQPSGATTLHKKEHGSKNEFVLLNVSPDGYPGERIEWIQNHTKTAQMHTKNGSKWSQNILRALKMGAQDVQRSSQNGQMASKMKP